MTPTVPIPPLPTQRKIAAILSAYDDLIENNNRRIKLLEEMAQRIYREWFVDFRYPGHEDVPLVDSELGPIPEGWAVGRLATSSLQSITGDRATEVAARPVDGMAIRSADIDVDGATVTSTERCDRTADPGDMTSAGDIADRLAWRRRTQWSGRACVHASDDQCRDSHRTVVRLRPQTMLCRRSFV